MKKWKYLLSICVLVNRKSFPGIYRKMDINKIGKWVLEIYR